MVGGTCPLGHPRDIFMTASVEDRSLKLVWVAPLAFLLAILVLWRTGSKQTYESASLLLALNLIFTTAVSGFIGVFAARSFIRSGQPGVLMMGCAMIVWGLSAFVATVGGRVGNDNIAIHNLGVFCSSCFHLAGVVFATRPDANLSSRRNGLILGYAGAIALVGLIWLAVIQGDLPVFFVQGQGGTPFRTAILATAITFFASVAAIMAERHRRAASTFLVWYATGLTLVGTGALGLLLQSTHGSLLGWCARAAQYLGGLHLLMAAVVAVRRGNWQIAAPPPALAEEDFRHVIRRAALWPLAVLLVLAATLIATVSFLLDSARSVEQAQEALGKISRLEKLAVDWETGLRGYDLTRQPVFLEPLERAQTVFPTELDALGKLVSDNPYQLGELAAVRELHSRWIAFAGEALARASAGHAADTALHLRGKHMMDSLRDRFDAMGEREERILASRALTLTRIRTIAFPGILLCTLVFVPFFIGAIRTALARVSGSYKLALLNAEAARDEAMAASRAKDDFLATLSHELRTPLNPVLLLVSDAQRLAELPPDVREDFTMIRDNVGLEARLIDDMLNLTRITTGKLALNLQPVAIDDLIRDAVKTIASDIAAKEIKVTVDLASQDTRVWGDPLRLQQVLWNVLKNAVKFTDPQGTVLVRTRPASSNDRVAVEVADNGIGMKPEEIARAFEPFRQGDHATATPHLFGGLGLGLAIARRLVELHGGTIQASSAGPGQGTRVLLELPTVPAGEVATIPAESNRSEASRALPSSTPVSPVRTLLVEDHVPTRVAVDRLLVRRGHRVVAVGTLADALNAARHQSFDLLISDVGLPDGTGYDLMRALQPIQAVPGIAMTGYGTPADIAAATDAGFVFHLTKPVDVKSLEQALAAATAQARPLKSARSQD